MLYAERGTYVVVKFHVLHQFKFLEEFEVSSDRIHNPADNTSQSDGDHRTRPICLTRQNIEGVEQIVSHVQLCKFQQ